MATQVAFQKLTIEELTMEFDMLSRMASGESVVTATVLCAVYSGEDSLASSMIDGDPSISNNIVSQRVKGGIAGVIYLVSCSVRTTSNNIYVNEAKLAVLTTTAVAPPIS